MSTKLDAYGGNTDRKFNPTGFFRTERASDRWWLVDPDGAAFISVGLNHADESNLKYPHNWDGASIIHRLRESATPCAEYCQVTLAYARVYPAYAKVSPTSPYGPRGTLK